jgi:hypothetical protein
MSKVTVVQINNQFFVPISNGLKEIPFAIVMEWQQTGSEVEITEVEQYV